MTTKHMQIKMLRLAYRAAKTDEEREIIKQHADLIKNPPTPEETKELETGAAELMKLPDVSNSYWDRYR